MNERSLPLLPIGVLALLVILTFWLSRFVQSNGGRADAKLRHDPDLIIEQLAARKLSITGEVEYKLHAEKLVHYADDDSSKVAGVLFTAVQPGKPLLTARAPVGNLYNGTDTIVLDGNVKIVSQASERQPEVTFTTPTLTLDTDKGTAVSKAGIVIVSNNSHIEAAKFNMNTVTRKYAVEQVTGSLQRIRK